MRTHTLRVLAALAAVAIFAAGCSSDDDTTDVATPDDQSDDGTDDTGDDDGDVVTITINADSIDVPDEIEGGAVSVAIEGELGPFTEANFTRVEDGTTEAEFTEAIGEVIQGGPFEDFLLNNAGAVPGDQPSVILLEPGEYFVWTEQPGDDESEEGEPEGDQPEGDQPEDGESGQGEGEGADEDEEEEAAPLLVSSLTVTGEGGGELPEGDGTITAMDYGFDVDVSAGERFAFVNDGPEQFHHAVIFNFGDLDPAVVEENIPEFFASEDAPPPDAFAELDFESFEAGGSGVFGPDSGGTFESTLESGNTYAAVCFISDRSGGPPHVAAYDMFEVFSVD